MLSRRGAAISTFFADEVEKRRIEPLKACRDAAERARTTAFVARQTAHQQVAAQCEQILRDVSSPEQLHVSVASPISLNFWLRLSNRQVKVRVRYGVHIRVNMVRHQR
jgi:hypothetical protein